MYTYLSRSGYEVDHVLLSYLPDSVPPQAFYWQAGDLANSGVAFCYVVLAVSVIQYAIQVALQLFKFVAAGFESCYVL